MVKWSERLRRKHFKKLKTAAETFNKIKTKNTTVDIKR